MYLLTDTRIIRVNYWFLCEDSDKSNSEVCITINVHLLVFGC